jgi:hypothetical protein
VCSPAVPARAALLIVRERRHRSQDGGDEGACHCSAGCRERQQGKPCLARRSCGPGFSQVALRRLAVVHVFVRDARLNIFMRAVAVTRARGASLEPL